MKRLNDYVIRKDGKEKIYSHDILKDVANCQVKFRNNQEIKVQKADGAIFLVQLRHSKYTDYFMTKRQYSCRLWCGFTYFITLMAVLVLKNILKNGFFRTQERYQEKYTNWCKSNNEEPYQCQEGEIFAVFGCQPMHDFFDQKYSKPGIIKSIRKAEELGLIKKVASRCIRFRGSRFSNDLYVVNVKKLFEFVIEYCGCQVYELNPLLERWDTFFNKRNGIGNVFDENRELKNVFVNMFNYEGDDYFKFIIDGKLREVNELCFTRNPEKSGDNTRYDKLKNKFGSDEIFHFDINSSTINIMKFLETGQGSFGQDLYKEVFDNADITKEWNDETRAHVKSLMMPITQKPNSCYALENSINEFFKAEYNFCNSLYKQKNECLDLCFDRQLNSIIDAKDKDYYMKKLLTKLSRNYKHVKQGKLVNHAQFNDLFDNPSEEEIINRMWYNFENYIFDFILERDNKLYNDKFVKYRSFLKGNRHFLERIKEVIEIRCYFNLDYVTLCNKLKQGLNTVIGKDKDNNDFYGRSYFILESFIFIEMRRRLKALGIQSINTYDEMYFDKFISEEEFYKIFYKSCGVIRDTLQANPIIWNKLRKNDLEHIKAADLA